MKMIKKITYLKLCANGLKVKLETELIRFAEENQLEDHEYKSIKEDNEFAMFIADNFVDGLEKFLEIKTGSDREKANSLIDNNLELYLKVYKDIVVVISAEALSEKLAPLKALDESLDLTRIIDGAGKKVLFLHGVLGLLGEEYRNSFGGEPDEEDGISLRDQKLLGKILLESLYEEIAKKED